jgi:hypothetical protein
MQRKISNVTTGVCTIYVDPMQRKIYNVTTEVAKAEIKYGIIMH